jgi:hypothetical protein
MPQLNFDSRVLINHPTLIMKTFLLERFENYYKPLLREKVFVIVFMGETYCAGGKYSVAVMLNNFVALIKT